MRCLDGQRTSIIAARSGDVWKATGGLETRDALKARRRVSLAAKMVILKWMWGC